MPKKSSVKNASNKLNGIVATKVSEENVEEVSSTTNDEEIVVNSVAKTTRKGRKGTAGGGVGTASAATVAAATASLKSTKAEENEEAEVVEKKPTRRGAKGQKAAPKVAGEGEEEINKVPEKKAGRVKKDAVIEATEVPEVVDAVTTKGKGRGKRGKVAAAEAVNEIVEKENGENTGKKPSGRGRKKIETSVEVEKQEAPVATAAAVVEEKKKPAARGRKNAEIEETKNEIIDQDPKSKKSRKRKAVTPPPPVVSEEVSKDSEIVTKGKKGKGPAGKKKKNSNEEDEELPSTSALKNEVASPEPKATKESINESNESPPKGRKGKVAAAAVAVAGGKIKKETIIEKEIPDEIESQPEEKADAEENSKRSRGGRKRAAKDKETVEEELVSKTKKVEKPTGRRMAAKKESDGNSNAKGLLNSVDTTYNQSDFDLVVKDISGLPEEKPFSLKISSWNVAGLRSWLKKDGLKFLEYEQPDIFCIQETKCTTDQLPDEARIPGYHPYWLCMPGGYAGVAVYSKIMPINVEYGIGDEEFDGNGRIITAEYEKFFLINVYVPNSGRGLVNLESRMRWEKLFQEYAKKLDGLKPLIICGDMNCSHKEIDLANPKTNTRSAGFTKEERDKMTELLALGFIDSFRHLYPDKIGAYTYWTYMSNARSRNVGWRLDYFIVSERFIKRVVDNCIRSQVKGSDHCPITLFVKN